MREGQFWDDLAEANPNVVIFDGPGPQDFFDCCIVGYASRLGSKPVLIYDEKKMITRMMLGERLSYEDAVEYLSFNTFGAWLGESTPMIMRRAPRLQSTNTQDVNGVTTNGRP